MNFIKGDREVIAASEALSPVWRFWWLVLKSGTVRVEQNEMMSAVAKENKFSRFLDHGIVPPRYVRPPALRAVGLSRIGAAKSQFPKLDVVGWHTLIRFDFRVTIPKM